MPSGTRDVGADAAATADLPFEDALEKLEAIVESLESRDLPLEKLIQLYKEGSELAGICQKRLTEAEVKIQEIEKDSNGDLKLKSLPNLSRETQD